MSILLHQSNTIVLMVPKCGSNWIRDAVDRINVSHSDIDAHINGGHHALARFGQFFSQSVAIVREPISWYHSYWSYRQRVGWGTAEIDQLAGSDNYVEYIRLALEKCPQYVTRLYQEFLGENLDEVDFVGELNDINRFFGSVLLQLGELDKSEELRAFPKLNSSNTECILSEDLMAKLRHSEHLVYTKFSRKFGWRV